MQRNHKSQSIYLNLCLAISFTVMANVAFASGTATQCDLLAGHPNDPKKLGDGVRWNNLDIDLAMPACEKEIKRQPENARIQFLYARVLDKQKSYNMAFAYYEKSAKKGYAVAQNTLGLAYEWGQGTDANYKEAVYWYRKAAEQGFAQAQNNLGTMYDSGKGVEEDEDKAIYWFQKAATQGYATAQRNLGAMYSSGDGVKQNHQTAFNWFLKAAKQDNSSAQYDVGLSYFYGKGVSSDRDLALSWIEKAANNGNYEAKQALYKMRFKKVYCDSLKSNESINKVHENKTSQKFLTQRECGG